MNTPDISVVKQCLVDNGYDACTIKYIPEGSNHNVFIVTLNNGTELIAKFAKTRYTEVNITGKNEDTLFGGQLSLEREESLYRLVREKTGLPAPKTYGIHDSDLGSFIMVEKMNGISHKEYLENNNHSKACFLDSLYKLGQNFAKAHNITFSSFGDVMTEEKIEPTGITNFYDRFYPIIQRRIQRANTKGAFSSSEHKEVSDFFKTEFDKYRNQLSVDKTPPTLVFTDMHGDNFFVDNDGKPSGYFDLESCQAAPAALEFYGLRFFIFNYYDADTFEEAEEAFFNGYKSSSGKYAPEDAQSHAFIDFLSAARLLELTDSYWGYIDGLRDTWGQRIKDLLFYFIKTKNLDYATLANIFRERDRQPIKPT